MKIIKYSTEGHYVRADQILRIVNSDSGVSEIYTKDLGHLYGDISVDQLVEQMKAQEDT